MTTELILGAIGLILGPYAGIRVGLNGTKEAVRRIETKVDSLTVELPQVRERVSVLEQRVTVEEKRS